MFRSFSTYKRRFAALLMTPLLIMSSLSLADIRPDQVRELTRTGKILPFETILDSVYAIKQGKLIEAELEKEDEQYIYDIEILDTHNRIWEFDVDAQTGAVLEFEQDD